MPDDPSAWWREVLRALLVIGFLLWLVNCGRPAPPLPSPAPQPPGPASRP